MATTREDFKEGEKPDTTVRSILDATLVAIRDEDLDAPPCAGGVDAFGRSRGICRKGGGYLAARRRGDTCNN